MKSFQHTQRNNVLKLHSRCLNMEAYQARMLATTLLGRLATEDNSALRFLKERISTDENWRVQEMLAKAFDEVCKHRGYEASLPLI